MKDLVEPYLKGTQEFSAMTEERTQEEIACDNEVIAGLRRNLSIKEALKVAGEKYLDEALQWNDETIHDIEAHYEHLRTIRRY